MRKGPLIVLGILGLVYYVAHSRSNPGATTSVPISTTSYVPPPTPPPDPSPVEPTPVPVPEKPNPTDLTEADPVGSGLGTTVKVAPPPTDPKAGSDEEMVMMTLAISVKADRDGKVNYCDGGTLELDGPNLKFTCPPPRADKSVHLSAAQIKGLDKNGIEAVGDEKYHFHVKDMSDADVETMFRNWYDRTASASKRGSK